MTLFVTAEIRTLTHVSLESSWWALSHGREHLLTEFDIHLRFESYVSNMHTCLLVRMKMTRWRRMTSLVETNSYFLKMALAGKSDVTRSFQTPKENFGYFWPSKNSRQRLSHFVEPVKNTASTEPPFGVGSGMFTNNFFWYYIDNCCWVVVSNINYFDLDSLKFGFF